MSSAPAGPRRAIVVAHPDDETLWLSSALAGAERLLFCFGDPYQRPRNALARRNAVAALDDARLTALAIPESGAGFSIDWTSAQPTDCGIAIRDASARARYEANYPRLLEALAPCLAGFDEVYTHNPWGEYGHAEHIQVFRAVRSLQQQLGFRLLFSHYVGPASWDFAVRLSHTLRWDERHAVAPDLHAAHALRRVYQIHGAWTWSRWHRWPARETIYGLLPGAAPDRGTPFLGESLQDVTVLRPWRSFGKPSLRRLPS